MPAGQTTSGQATSGVGALRAGQWRLQTPRLFQVLTWSALLLVALFVGIGPALLRNTLRPMLDGRGTAAARVALVQDDVLGQLCLLQQLESDPAGGAGGQQGAGPLPAELLLDSALLQWAAKAVEQAYRPPEGVLYTPASPTPTYHRVLLGTTPSAPAPLADGTGGGAQVLWSANPTWALATSGFYRMLTLGALLPRQLDLTLTYSAAGSCELGSTGGLPLLAAVPLPGAEGGGACPDLTGVLVARSASAPLDANRYYTVSCPDGLQPGEGPLKPWSQGRLLSAAAGYSAALCALAAVALTALAARWAAGVLRRRYVALADALQQLHDVGQVQLPDGNFLVKVRAPDSSRVAVAVGGQASRAAAGAVAEATEDDKGPRVDPAAASAPASAPASAASPTASSKRPPPSGAPAKPAAAAAAAANPYAAAAKDIQARAAAAAAAAAARQAAAKEPPKPPVAPPVRKASGSSPTPYDQQKPKAPAAPASPAASKPAGAAALPAKPPPAAVKGGATVAAKPGKAAPAAAAAGTALAGAVVGVASSAIAALPGASEGAVAGQQPAPTHVSPGEAPTAMEPEPLVAQASRASMDPTAAGLAPEASTHAPTRSSSTASHRAASPTPQLAEAEVSDAQMQAPAALVADRAPPPAQASRAVRQSPSLDGAEGAYSPAAGTDGGRAADRSSAERALSGRQQSRGEPSLMDAVSAVSLARSGTEAEAEAALAGLLGGDELDAAAAEPEVAGPPAGEVGLEQAPVERGDDGMIARSGSAASSVGSRGSVSAAVPARAASREGSVQGAAAAAAAAREGGSLAGEGSAVMGGGSGGGELLADEAGALEQQEDRVDDRGWEAAGAGHEGDGGEEGEAEVGDGGKEQDPDALQPEDEDDGNGDGDGGDFMSALGAMSSALAGGLGALGAAGYGGGEGEGAAADQLGGRGARSSGTREGAELEGMEVEGAEDGDEDGGRGAVASSRVQQQARSARGGSGPGSGVPGRGQQEIEQREVRSSQERQQQATTRVVAGGGVAVPAKAKQSAQSAQQQAPAVHEELRQPAASPWEDFEKHLQAAGEGVDDAAEDAGPVAWQYHIKTRLGTYLPLTFPSSPLFESKNVLRALLGLKYFVVMPQGHTAASSQAAQADASAEETDLAAAELTGIEERGGARAGQDEAWAAPSGVPPANPALAWTDLDERRTAPYKPTPYELYVRDLEVRLKRDRLWRLRRWYAHVHSTENRWLQVYQDSKTAPTAVTQQLLKASAASEEPQWMAGSLKGTMPRGGLMGEAPPLGASVGAMYAAASPSPLASAPPPPQYHDAPPELRKLLHAAGGAAAGGGAPGGGASAGAGASLPAAAGVHALPPALAAAASEVLGLAGCLEMAMNAVADTCVMLWGAVRAGCGALLRSAAAAAGRGRGAGSAGGQVEPEATARLLDGGASAKVLLEAAVKSLAVLAQEAGSPRALHAAVVAQAAQGAQLDRMEQELEDDSGVPAEALAAVAASFRSASSQVVHQFLRDLWAVPPQALPAAQKRGVMLRLGQHALAAARRAVKEGAGQGQEHKGGSAAGDAALPPATDSGAWSKMVWDAALGDIRAALKAMDASQQQQEGTGAWRRRLAAGGAAAGAVRSRASRMLGLRILAMLLLGCLVPFFTCLLAASTAALWAAPSSHAWAASTWGFCMLLLPGGVTAALLALDVCAALGISAREAFAGGRRRPGTASVSGVLMSNDSFRGTNKILPLVKEAHGEAMRGEDLEAATSSRPVAGADPRWPARLQRLLRSVCVGLFLLHLAGALWYGLMLAAWLGLSAVLGAVGALALASTIGSGVAVLVGHYNTLSASAAAVCGRLQRLVGQHTSTLRGAANRLGLYTPTVAPSAGRAAFVQMLQAQTQAAMLNVNRNTGFLQSRLASRALPPGWLLGSLAGVTVLYGAGLAFIYVGAAAFGVSLQWGIAVAAPLSGLASYARGRRAVAAHVRRVQGLLPAAVGQAVQTAKDVVCGQEAVDGGLGHMEPPPPPPAPVRPETELEIGMLRLNTTLTSIINIIAHNQEKDGEEPPPSGGSACCGGSEDPALSALISALLKMWLELTDKPEEPEPSEDLIPYIWAAVQTLQRDSRNHSTDLTNLSKTIGVDNWVLDRGNGRDRDGPASLHSRMPDMRKVPYETSEILRRLKALSLTQPTRPQPPLPPHTPTPGGDPRVAPPPQSPSPFSLDELSELLAQLQRCLSSAELLDTSMGIMCNRVKEVKPDMQTLLTIAKETRSLDPERVQQTSAAIKALDPSGLRALLDALAQLDAGPLAAVQAAIAALAATALPAAAKVEAAVGALPGKVQPTLEQVQQRVEALDAGRLKEVQEAIDALDVKNVRDVEKAVKTVVTLVGELPGKVEPPVQAVAEALSKLETSHLKEVQEAINSLSAEGISQVKENINTVMTLVCEMPIKVEPAVRGVAEQLAKLDASHLKEVQEAINAMDVKHIREVEEKVSKVVSLVAELPDRIERPIAAAQEAVSKLDVAVLASVQQSISDLKVDHLVKVQEDINGIRTAHLQDVQEAIDSLRGPSAPDPVPIASKPPPGKKSFGICRGTDVVEPEPRSRGEDEQVPWARLEKEIWHVKDTSVQILDVVKNIKGVDGRDGKDGRDRALPPERTPLPPQAGKDGKDGGCADLLPELQRLLDELRQQLLDRLGGAERVLGESVTASGRRVLEAVAGIKTGGGGGGGGGGEVDLGPVRDQLTRVEATLTEKFEEIEESYLNLNQCVVEIKEDVLRAGVGAQPAFCANRPGLPSSMTVAAMLDELRRDLLDELDKRGPSIGVDDDPLVIGKDGGEPQDGGEPEELGGGGGGQIGATSKQMRRVVQLLQRLQVNVDVLVTRSGDEPMREQFALLIAMLQRLFVWVTGERYQGAEALAGGAADGGSSGLLVVLNSSLVKHHKKMVALVVKELAGSLDPLGRIESRLRELVGDEVPMVDLGGVAEAQAAAAARAAAGAEAGADAGAVVALRTAGQRKPSLADLYRLLPEVLHALFNLRPQQVVVQGGGVGGVGTPSPAAQAGGVLNKWQTVTLQSAITELRSRVEQLHVVVTNQVPLIRATVVPDFLEQVRYLLGHHGYTKRFQEMAEGETLMEVVEKLLEWKTPPNRPAPAPQPPPAPIGGSLKDKLAKVLPVAPYLREPLLKRRERIFKRFADKDWQDFMSWLDSYMAAKGIRLVDSTGGWLAPYFTRGGGTVTTYLADVEKCIDDMGKRLRAASAVAAEPSRYSAYDDAASMYGDAGIYDDDEGGEYGDDDDLGGGGGKVQWAPGGGGGGGGGSSQRRNSALSVQPSSKSITGALAGTKASGSQSRRVILQTAGGRYDDDDDEGDGGRGVQGGGRQGDKSRPTSAAAGSKSRPTSAKQRGR